DSKHRSLQTRRVRESACAPHRLRCSQSWGRLGFEALAAGSLLRTSSPPTGVQCALRRRLGRRTRTRLGQDHRRAVTPLRHPRSSNSQPYCSELAFSWAPIPVPCTSPPPWKPLVSPYLALPQPLPAAHTARPT